MNDQQHHTPESVAAMGLPGLSSPEMVRHYRDSWFAVRPMQKFGSTVDLPDHDFPE